MIILADCVDNLFQNQYFDQSELVESWWHNVYQKWIQQEQYNQGQNHITIICPHLGTLMGKHPFDQHKHKIFNNHSATIDIAGNIIMASPTSVKGAKQKQKREQEQPQEPTISQIGSQIYILVAEPDPDLQQIYDIWLHYKGFKNILVTDSGRKIIEEFIKIKNKPNFNVIAILDSHIKDISFMDLAKEITNQKPNSQIILTTTSPSYSITSTGIDSNNSKILSKPFRLPELLSLVGNSS